MAASLLDKKDMIDTVPAQSHVHQEVRGMCDKVLVTREPYGKPGTFDSESSRSIHGIKVAKQVD
jgi:hypothetical protein